MAKDRKRSRSRSRERDRDRAKDKEKSRQKESKRDRDGRDRDRDRDYERERERDRRDRDKKRARSRSRSRSPDRKRDRYDRHDRGKERDKGKSHRDSKRDDSPPKRGDRDRDRDRARDRERDRDRDRGRDREKDKERDKKDKGKAKGGKTANGGGGGGGLDLFSKLAAISARVVERDPLQVPSGAGVVSTQKKAATTVAATVAVSAVLAATAAPVAVAVPTGVARSPPEAATVVSSSSGAAAVAEAVAAAEVGEAAGAVNGAKLEASLLASLQKKIKARAAAPEKLKTTGVAFQAVEEVVAPPAVDSNGPFVKKLALAKGGGKPLGKVKGKLAFGRMNKGKPALPKKPAGWGADDEEESDEDAEDDKTFFGMDTDTDKQERQGLPPWDGNGEPTMTNGDRASSGSGAAGLGAAGGAESMGSAAGGANGPGGEEEDDPLDAFMTDLQAPAVAQDNMSAAFGAGDFMSSAGANIVPSSIRVKEIMANTISLEEIMNATRTTETWESDVMESESDRGNSDDDEEYRAAFSRERAVDVDSADDSSTPFRRKPRKVKRRNGQKYYPPPEFVPADVGPNGAPIIDESVPVFNETAEQRREREEEEEREDRERKEFMESFRKAREEEEEKRALRVAKQEEEDEKAEEGARRKEEKLGRMFAGEGDVMEEHERDKVEQNALQLLQDSMKKKELKPVDHSKISYIEVRKNLYIIPKALANVPEEQKEQARQNLEVKVRGKGCPPVVDTWEQCGFSDRVLAVIRRNKFELPFPIQRQAMPALMSGRDVIGVARTGSGKTLAFLLPMLRHILDQPILAEGEGPIGLIMAPARELAVQIYNESKRFTRALGLRVTAVYGGAGVADQIADLKRGAEIVVCTPGRMIDILTMQAGKLVQLDRVSSVVLDEADRMFDMGFEPQIKMILQNVRPDRQTALFSATFPRTVENLAKKVLHMPLEIIVGGRSVASSDIKQHVEIRDDDDKFMRLLQLLGVWYEKGNILVFVDTQQKCDTLFQDLSRAGYNGLSLHGGKDQTDRDFTIADFKNKSATLMVATSVAGRGLDVPDLVCVINYSCPNHLEDYVHRVGRTGRAGRKGTAYTFISAEEEQHAPTLIKALTQSKQKVPDELVKMAEGFKTKVDKGEARYASSGFSGKGFTFDDTEQSESQQMRSLEKRQYEIEQGLRDPSELLGGKGKGEGEEEDGEDETEAAKVAREENLTKAAMSAANKLMKSTDPVEKMKGTAMMTAAKLGLCVPRPEPGEEGTAKQNTPQEALKEATSVALKYYHPNGKGADGEPTHFTDKIEINDYPQQARWKITQKSTVNEVVEHTGVAIITKGVYIGNNQKPKDGEEKLHLVIEGTSELDVQAGKKEIQRILNEETMKVASSSSFSSGKYSVI